MKTIKITVEIEVPDDATHVAMDSNGEFNAFDLRPRIYEPTESPEDGFWIADHPSLFLKKIVPKNWRETLTEVEK